MGRGLAAIIADTAAQRDASVAAASLQELPLDLVVPNPAQPRRAFDEEALRALADSISERGVLQPVLVRPRPAGRYELVAGERRWRAAGIAGLETLPALVQERDDAVALEVALVENMARADLNPVEEARAVSALVEDLGLTREAVGRRVGRSRVAISNLLRILELPDEALDLVGEGRLTEGHARALLLAEDHADRRALARSAADEAWSVRVLEDRARGTDGHAGGRPAAARRGRGLHPDEAEAMEELADGLGRALGADVRARPRGGGVVCEVRLASLEDARALVERLGG